MAGMIVKLTDSDSDYRMYVEHTGSSIDKVSYDILLYDTMKYITRFVMILGDKIVSSGTFLLEHKLTHGGCLCGHIEDIFTTHIVNSYIRL